MATSIDNFHWFFFEKEKASPKMEKILQESQAQMCMINTAKASPIMDSGLNNRGLWGIVQDKTPYIVHTVRCFYSLEVFIKLLKLLSWQAVPLPTFEWSIWMDPLESYYSSFECTRCTHMVAPFEEIGTWRYINEAQRDMCWHWPTKK